MKENNTAPSIWAADEPRNGSAALQHIKVQGAVFAPGEYPFEEDTDVLHYLRKAGGATAEVRLCKVMIIRNYGAQNRTLVFRLDQNGSLPKVKSGDVLVFDRAETKPAPQREESKERAVVELKPKPRREFFPLSPAAVKQPAQDLAPFRVSLEQYIRAPQFKRLLNQIATAQAATGIKSIAVLSYHPGEGKSFFSAALALAYAKFLDSHVLILDTKRSVSERSPMIKAIAGEYNATNSAASLDRASAYIDVVTMDSLERTGDADSDFYVGPYLNSVKEKYDLIVVDTTAVTSPRSDTIDPIVVANQVDSSILVTSKRSAHKSALQSIAADKQRFNLRLMGTVFNAVGAR